jgi:hypothetical protein
MGKVVRSGAETVGEGEPCFVIAEISIDHNGSLELAKPLSSARKEAGADAVEFQKRTVDAVRTPEEAARPRESPFGTINGELKRGLGFGDKHYAEIDRYCREQGLVWLASSWGEPADHPRGRVQRPSSDNRASPVLQLFPGKAASEDQFGTTQDGLFAAVSLVNGGHPTVLAHLVTPGTSRRPARSPRPNA